MIICSSSKNGFSLTDSSSSGKTVWLEYMVAKVGKFLVNGWEKIIGKVWEDNNNFVRREKIEIDNLHMLTKALTYIINSVIHWFLTLQICILLVSVFITVKDVTLQNCMERSQGKFPI